MLRPGMGGVALAALGLLRACGVAARSLKHRSLSARGGVHNFLHETLTVYARGRAFLGQGGAAFWMAASGLAASGSSALG